VESESGFWGGIALLHPHPIGLEVVHQALLLLVDFDEVEAIVVNVARGFWGISTSQTLLPSRNSEIDHGIPFRRG